MCVSPVVNSLALRNLCLWVHLVKSACGIPEVCHCSLYFDPRSAVCTQTIRSIFPELYDLGAPSLMYRSIIKFDIYRSVTRTELFLRTPRAKTLPKQGLILKERICSQREHILSSQISPYFGSDRGGQMVRRCRISYVTRASN